MRNKFITCLILGIFLCTEVSGKIEVRAQTTYERLRDDYWQAFDTYKLATDEYVQARSEYLKFKTLVSQTVAAEKTRVFLAARQEVMITYLKMIKERLEQSPELTEEELKIYLPYINQELDLLAAEKPKFAAAQDLNNLVKMSKATEQRYNLFVANGFKMQGLVISGKVRSLRKTGEELNQLTSEQTARLQKENLIDTTKIERWLLAVPERLALSRTIEEAALLQFSTLKDKDSMPAKENKFNLLQSELRNATQYLKEAKSFMLQIIQDIRFD